MPSAERRIQDDIEKFLIPLKRARRSKRTIEGYTYILTKVLIYLLNQGYNTSVKTIGSAEIEFLINTWWTGAPKYNHNRRSVFRQYLQYHGNRVFDEYPEPYGGCMRINVDWLSNKEAVRVYSVSMTPIEKLIIHLELKLGLRRHDILNLSLQDVNHSHIVVHGKGNKTRTVPILRDFRTVLQEYMKYRNSIINDDSDDSLLLIPIKTVHKPGKTYVDNVIKRVCKRAGIERSISNHTLRRTCARMWYRAGATLVTISSLLGHTDVKTTMIYLGLTMDDLNTGGNLFDTFFQSISDEMDSETDSPEIGQNNDTASKISGQGEI